MKAFQSRLDRLEQQAAPQVIGVRWLNDGRADVAADARSDALY